MWEDRQTDNKESFAVSLRCLCDQTQVTDGSKFGCSWKKDAAWGIGKDTVVFPGGIRIASRSGTRLTQVHCQSPRFVLKVSSHFLLFFFQ